VKTNCGGSLPIEGLLLNPFTVSWVVMMAFVSHGKVFGELRFL